MFMMVRWFGAYGDLYLAVVCAECVDSENEEIVVNNAKGKCCERCGAEY